MTSTSSQTNGQTDEKAELSILETELETFKHHQGVHKLESGRRSIYVLRLGARRHG